MSRIGKRIIKVPSNVSVSIADGVISAQGNSGKLDLGISDKISVVLDGDRIMVTPKGEPTPMWGTTNALIFNMIKGVSEGFTIKLKLVGVGFRAILKGDKLNLKLAYSHDIALEIPNGISVNCPEATKIEIKGACKSEVGLFASRIKRLKPVDPYRGKGIFFEDEVIVKKEGKKK